MQPKLCTKCKKNMAVVFITKIENGVSMNEGYCLKCARSLGIPQIDAAVKQMGFSDEDLDSLSDEMSNMFGQLDGEDSDEPESRTATFPMLNQLFGSMGEKGNPPAQKQEPAGEQQSPKEKGKKHKFLDSYCMNLTGRAREGKLDKVIGTLDFVDVIAGGHAGSLRPDGSIEAELQVITGATNEMGFNCLSAR